MTRSICALLPLLALLLASCSASGNKYGRASLAEAPVVINVSAYDPKERQRKGRGYTPLDQSALKANGSRALIARIAKGTELDTKCADFLVGAERQGMKIGTYFYVKPGISIEAQARRYVARLKAIKRQKGLRSKEVLLVGDIDTKCSSGDIVRFIEEMERLTGVTPVIYLENSAGLITRLAAAPAAHKRIIRRAPYWLALYSHTNEKNPHIKTPQDLTQAYGIWNTWAMWQYGGVFWERGRSAPKVYNHGAWRAPRYFGNLDRPCERNAFNGTPAQFEAFWAKHSWNW